MSPPHAPSGTPVAVVVDASAIVEIALDSDTPRRRAVLEVLQGDPVWVIPDYTDIEVVSAVGRVVGQAVNRRSSRGGFSPGQARRVLELVSAMPFTRVPVRGVTDRVLELMSNHSAYDAGYIAIAERIDAPVLTLDRGIASSAVARCRFVHLT